VTEAVVDRFETVDVDHGDDQATARQGVVHHAFDLILGRGVVEQAGQAVVAGRVEHFPVALDLGLDHRRQNDRIGRLGQELVAAEAQGLNLLSNIAFA